VIESRGGTRLALEPFERARISGELIRKKFQRDLTAQADIFRPEYNTHPAAAKFVKESIVRNSLARHLRNSEQTES
jgi:hypothetical protein